MPGDPERSPAENTCVTAAAATATVSSLKSEDSTEQLICNPPPKVRKTKVPSVTESAGARGDGRSRRRLVGWLGLAQVALGALLVGAGALAAVRGAALARAGGGLWAGCAAVAAGVVGVLAGVDDCYGLSRAAATAGRSGSGSGGPFLSAFLALSLVCLACGHAAAALAATGLQRDVLRAHALARSPLDLSTFQDEMDAWSPVLANIAVLALAGALCLVSAASVWLAARRACRCLRGRRAHFEHNQFEPHKRPPPPPPPDPARDLCLQLEGKLQGEEKKEGPEYGSANSKEKLVTRWLGHHAGGGGAGGAARAAPAGPPARGVRKPRAGPAPLLLLPAPATITSTLGRVPAACVMGPPRYATLPLPPAQYAHAPHPHPHPHAPHPHHVPIYYPLHDARVRRRRSPREYGGRGERRGRRRDGRERERERDSQLTRSLERIHRKRRAGAERERVSDAELKRTYTGLDRAYAEQFIAVCDETRHAHAHAHEGAQHDSLASASSDTSRAS